ncbi:MAG: Uma2 family endonuclease [Caldilineaceae bacterium]
MTLVQEHQSQVKHYTVDEFERFLRLPENLDRLFELIDGAIVEKMPTQEHGLVATNLVIALGSFVKAQKLGRVGVEVRHQLPKDHANSRMPDVSFTSARQPLVKQGSVPQMPDLAIEIQSPDDTIKQLREKAAYYLEHGARLVWLIYPRKRFIEVYSLDNDVEILLEGDVLTGADVLPDFFMPVADIFADPLAD